MGFAISGLGAILIALVMMDFLATTIGASAYSPMSKYVARGAFALVRRFPDSNWKHRFSGVLVMTAIAMWWIIGIACGWSLIFGGIGTGVVNAETEMPASISGILSHVGHLLSTVGGGVTSPNGVGSALLGVLVGVNGMVVLTLSVSFVLSTTQTVANGRAFLMKVEAADLKDRNVTRSVLFELADLIAMLNAAPFALYYSNPAEDRRLPSGLEKLSLAWPTDTHAEFRNVLRELPWFDPGELGEWTGTLSAWSQRYAV